MGFQGGADAPLALPLPIIYVADQVGVRSQHRVPMCVYAKGWQQHMRQVRRLLFRLGAALGVCALLVGGGGWLYARRSLPQTSGTLYLDGPHGSIEIIRDIDNVPHIYASERHDVFFGLGYVHAQDRLWQMELQRRAGQGRLSEVLGSAALSPDRYLRTLGVYRAAQRDWEQLSPQTREIVSAYTEGINAFLRPASRSMLPPEFTLLGVTPEPWAGPDVLVRIKMVALDLGGDNEAELLRHDLAATLGVDRAYDLMPAAEASALNSASLAMPTRRLQRLAETTQQVRALLDTVRLGGEGSDRMPGSSMAHAAQRALRLLANDPHLTSRAPLLWYQVHLVGGGIEVAGASIPGLPGVVVGRNRFIVWGVTNLRADTQDFFQERIDPSGRLAEFDGRMEPMQIFTETIKLRGQADVRHVVRMTRHGPLISDAINADDAMLPDAVRPPPLEPLALRWVALDPGDTTLEGLLGINDAHNWQDLTQKLRLLVAPAQYIVYADVEGNIGATAVGRIPTRRGYDDWYAALS